MNIGKRWIPRKNTQRSPKYYPPSPTQNPSNTQDRTKVGEQITHTAIEQLSSQEFIISVYQGAHTNDPESR